MDKIYPDSKTMAKNGYYGSFGGRFVPEVLNARLDELNHEFHIAINSKAFHQELDYHLKTFVGRPSPLYFAENLSRLSGKEIFLKREDLNHTGAHKINNALGQAMLARSLGYKELVAETGAGQHGVATATVAAKFGMRCTIFMGEEDIKRQRPNVERMKLLGADVKSTSKGEATLSDAVDAALDFYIQNPQCFYLLGSQVGPDPYPSIVGYFQEVIGREAKRQILEVKGKLPDSIYAAVGGGSNAIGIFSAFLDDKDVRLWGAEGGGKSDRLHETAATLSLGRAAVFQGTFSLCLTDEEGNPVPAWSAAAGLDYPGISPQHAYLKESKRVSYFPVYDEEAYEAFKILSQKEGIIPALESAHAIALALRLKPEGEKTVVINLSGRGDKDLLNSISKA